MNQQSTFIAQVRRVLPLVITGVLGCANHPIGVPRSADRAIVATTKSTAAPEPFVYHPPTTTPYDSDPRGRERYLKAYHAGWNHSSVVGDGRTYCELPPLVAEAHYEGQRAGDELFYKYLKEMYIHLSLSDSLAQDEAAQIEVLRERVRLTREQAEAHPVRDWYISDVGKQK